MTPTGRKIKKTCRITPKSFAKKRWNIYGACLSQQLMKIVGSSPARVWGFEVFIYIAMLVFRSDAMRIGIVCVFECNKWEKNLKEIKEKPLFTCCMIKIFKNAESIAAH
jgi:hypothetical protein